METGTHYYEIQNPPHQHAQAQWHYLSSREVQARAQELMVTLRPAWAT